MSLRPVCFSHHESATYTFPSSSLTLPGAILLADVDDDADFELVIGSLDGSLCVYKGFLSDDQGPWLKSSGLGSVTCLAVGPLFLGTTAQQLLACTSEGALHIFDLSHAASSVPSGQLDVAPIFTMESPLNVSAMCVAAPMGLAATDYRPDIGLATSDGCLCISRLEFHTSSWTGEPISPVYRSSDGQDAEHPDPMSPPRFRETEHRAEPHLVPMLKHSVGATVASLAARMIFWEREGEDSGTGSARWEYIVGLEEGTFFALLVFEMDGESGLHAEPLRVFPGGGGLPLSLWGWSGGTRVLGGGQSYLGGLERSFTRDDDQEHFSESSDEAGGGFCICTMDGRVACIDVNHPGGDQEDGESTEPYWKTRWCHQLREPFFCLGRLPYSGPDGPAEALAACSWSGRTFIIDADGQAGILFDASEYIEQPLQSFTSGKFAIQPGRNEPVLVYASSSGEILVYYGLWAQVGQLDKSSSGGSFHERIVAHGGTNLLRRLLVNAQAELVRSDLGTTGDSSAEEVEDQEPGSGVVPLPSPSLHALAKVLLRRPAADVERHDDLSPSEILQEAVNVILQELNEWEAKDAEDFSCFPALRHALTCFALIGQGQKEDFRMETRFLRDHARERGFSPPTSPRPSVTSPM
jgi:hypothetical protein